MTALVGKATPRIMTPPAVTGPVGPCLCGECALTPATSLGFSVIEFAEMAGVALLPWQAVLVVHGMELRPDGLPRFRTVLAFVARQSGKTTLLKVVAGFWLLIQQVPLILGVSTKLETAAEAWKGCLDLLRSSEDLAPLVAEVRKTNGQECITTVDGCRYKIAASNDDAGRGFTIHRLIMDEVRQQRNWNTWSAAVKAMTAVADAQAWCISNAGTEESIVLNTLRATALSQIETGATEDLIGLFEWSAEEACALDDPEAWAQSNPSLGYTITEAAIRAALVTDPEGVFRSEVLCQSVQSLDAWQTALVAAWTACRDSSSVPDGRVSIGADIALDRSSGSIGVCGTRADGLFHVEDIDTREGTEWMVDRLVELYRKHRVPIVLDPYGPAGTLVIPLQTEGVQVIGAGGKEIVPACGLLYDAITGGKSKRPTVRHRGRPDLTAAVEAASRRKVGDAWRWERREDAQASIAPLYAVTLAYMHHRKTARSRRVPNVAFV